MLAALVNERGQVQMPGFYDDVVPLIAPTSGGSLPSLPFDEAEFHAADRRRGSGGRRRLHDARTPLGPAHVATSTACASGYQGEGAKTVLPARAGAKFSFRLVPRQDPNKIAAALEQRLRALCPPGIRMELIDIHGAPGVVVPLESPYMAAAGRAIEQGFGRRAGVHARRGLDPGRGDLSRNAGSRYAAAGLGPGRRQHAQPERKILPGRFPSRHQGQRTICGEELARRSRQMTTPR